MQGQLRRSQETTGRIVVLMYCVIMTSCTEVHRDKTGASADDVEGGALPGWTIGPFVKADAANPCLSPNAESTFFCPVRQASVHWEIKDVFNPAAIVSHDTLRLIYRAEDTVGRHAGTSRLGIAKSMDGLTFTRAGAPVLFPDRDSVHRYEWEGGCEDPRIVRRDDGRYVMTYTAYDGAVARLCVASSEDLYTWEKHGPAFSAAGVQYLDMWSKSGSVVSAYGADGSIAAVPVNDTYWMYWGDKDIFLAHSSDLIRWEPLVDSAGELIPVLTPRDRMFDSDLVEPGPPAIVTDDGIVLIYNSRNYGALRDTSIIEGTYSAGQALFALSDPGHLIERTNTPFFIPDKAYEIEGQVRRVVFVEGLVRWEERWLLYYGTADSHIAVASCNAQK